MAGKVSSPAQPNGNDKNGSIVFRRFVTRNGKTYDAYDYGHLAWPIRGARKKKGPRPK